MVVVLQHGLPLQLTDLADLQTGLELDLHHHQIYVQQELQHLYREAAHGHGHVMDQVGEQMRRVLRPC